jgi:hypothetical protein
LLAMHNARSATALVGLGSPALAASRKSVFVNNDAGKVVCVAESRGAEPLLAKFRRPMRLCGEMST